MEPSADLGRAALLMPLATGVRSDTVVERLSAAVRLGLMVDGEQLPNESELAAQLNVSTVTLREALGRLRAQGIIETRRGRHGGSFIRFVQHQSNAELDARLSARSSAEWRDFGEEHVAISGRAAWLAARRATSGEIDNLYAMARGLDPESTRAEHQRADSRFHIALAVASQSERILASEVRLEAESIELVWFVGGSSLDADQVNSQHIRIVDAIASQDEAEARALAEQHVIENVRRVARAAAGIAERPVTQEVFSA